MSRRTSLQAKASIAGVLDFGALPRKCDFARLVDDRLAVAVDHGLLILTA